MRSCKTGNVFVKDKPFLRRDLWQLRAVYDCWKNAYKLPHPESYCRPRPWNFEVMDKVKRELIVCRKAQFLSYDLNWFDYGYINAQGQWAIEKDHLLALLENAVSRNGADLCPLFNWSKVEAVIKGLPDTLDLAALEEMRRQKETVFGFTVGVKEEATGENVLPFERRRK